MQSQVGSCIKQSKKEGRCRIGHSIENCTVGSAKDGNCGDGVSCHASGVGHDGGGNGVVDWQKGGDIIAVLGVSTGSLGQRSVVHSCTVPFLSRRIHNQNQKHTVGRTLC